MIESSKGMLEYVLVCKHRTSPGCLVRFGHRALVDQLELAGRVAAKRRRLARR